LTLSWWFLSTTIVTNTWIKLHARMVAGIRGFNSTWLSCKKYKAILKEYRNDKKENEISGTDRKQDCRWFDEMDIWNNTRASIKNAIPASITDEMRTSTAHLHQIHHLHHHYHHKLLLQHQNHKRIRRPTKKKCRDCWNM
jgi:hypothetical protein